MLFPLAERIKEQPGRSKSYRGIVVDVDDPDGQSRVRCLIAGIYEVSSDFYDRLPWCTPRGMSQSGGRPDQGSFAVPNIRSEVTIVFPNADLYAPEYVGPWEGQHLHTGELWDQNYPETVGWLSSVVEWILSDKSRPYIEFFRQANKEFLSLDEEGTLTLRIPKDVKIEVLGDLKTLIIGDQLTHVQGDQTTKVDGDQFTFVDGSIQSVCQKVKIEAEEAYVSFEIAQVDTVLTFNGELNVVGPQVWTVAPIMDTSGALEIATEAKSLAESIESELTLAQVTAQVAAYQAEVEQIEQKVNQLLTLAQQIKQRAADFNQETYSSGIEGVWG